MNPLTIHRRRKSKEDHALYFVVDKKGGFSLFVVLPRCEHSEISSKTLGSFSFIIFLEFKLDSNEEG
jgi:hypothetical protein